MNFPDIKIYFNRILSGNKSDKQDQRRTKGCDMGAGGIITVLSFSLITFVLLFCFNVIGCRYFPALAQGCTEPSLLFKILYGLLYTLVVLTLIIVPLISIVFFRVTIVMPISKWIYGDENILDARFFGWFDNCWSACQRLILK